MLYERQSRYAEAEQFFERAARCFKRRRVGPPVGGHGPKQPGHLYQVQGRYAEAEPLYKRSLAIRERRWGPTTPMSARCSTTWPSSIASSSQRRGGAALQAFAGHPREDAGRRTSRCGTIARQLSLALPCQGRYSEAEPLYERSLAIRKKALGAEHPDAGQSLNNLALLYQVQGRYEEVELLHKRALELARALSPDHPWVGTSLNNLAWLYQAQGRYAEAKPLYEHSLAITEKALGPDHPSLGLTLDNLAGLHFLQRDWARAADFWRRSTGISIRRARRSSDAVGQAVTGKSKGDAEQNSDRFRGLIKAVHRLPSDGGIVDADLAAELFQTVQWAISSEAAASLAQMAARQTKGDSALARLARERQNLVGEWQVTGQGSRRSPLRATGAPECAS